MSLGLSESKAVAVIVVLYLFGVAAFCKAMAHITRPTPQSDKAALEAYYRRAVEVAGGQYVGIQEGESEGVEPDGLVLFNSHKTGSTLAVKEKDFTVVAVGNRIEQHEAEWGI